MSNHIVEIRNLSKVFSRGFLRKHSFAAVNNVSLTVEAGETFCLIGPNGAGKTTLIRMLLNLIEPTSGSAFIFGESNKAPASRECVGYFPERFKPPPTLTIRQFLYHWGQFSGLAGAQLKSRITELLQAVRLSDKHDVPMKKLSKGMTVRVGLAQAMINDPGLLILDEPTDGLDPLGRVEFREILNGLHSKGKTILINSHLLSEVEQISQRIGIMKKGELLRVDTLGHLLAEKARLSIVFACNSPEIIKALKEQFVVEEKDGLMAVQLSDRSAVDSVLKKLGTHDLVIKNIVESKGALEEEFLSILGNS